MKANKLLIVNLLLATFALIGANGCKPDEDPVEPEKKAPVIQLSSDLVEVPVEGGQFTMTYIVENPVEGASVSAKCEENWIGGFDFGTEGKISFTVAANESELRTASIRVSYPEAESSPVFTVKQAAFEAPAEEADFVMEVSNVDLKTADVKIVPKDKEMEYFFFKNTAAYFEENALAEDEALFQHDIAYLKEDGEFWGETLSQTYTQYAKKGDIEGTLKDMDPGTEYIGYVYGVKLNGEEIIRLTDILRVSFTTRQVEQVDVSFMFDITVDGPAAHVAVDPGNYDGAYYLDVLEGVGDKKEAAQQAVDKWNQNVSMLLMFGYDAAGIIEELCMKGATEKDLNLLGETQYMAYAMAINQDAMCCSEVSVESFQTGKVEMSDNKISIVVDQIKARSAYITVTTTNNDPYCCVICSAEELAGKSDEEIIAYSIENIGPSVLNGGYSETVNSLSPEYSYIAIAYGYAGGMATTGLTKFEFSTPEPVIGTATISATYDKFYDIEAVAALDPSKSDYVGQGDCFLPVYITTDPVDAEVFYYGIFVPQIYEDFGQELTDELLYNMLIAGGAATHRDNAYIMTYGEECIIAAMVEDAEGNMSKVWRSEPFKLIKGDASDPQEFLDKYGAPAKRRIRTPFALAGEDMLPHAIVLR